MWYKKRKKGLTLVEVMVVMAIMGVLISFGTIISFSSYKKYYFRSERTILVSILERARSRAMSNYYETSHGVCYIAPNYIIFRGTTCSSSLATNETMSANSTVANASSFSSAFPTIVFSQLSATTTPATINITDGITSGSITINSEGTINW